MFILLLFGSYLPIFVDADSISGPASSITYYHDDIANTGLLDLSDGKTWTLSFNNINASQITGDKLFTLFVQDCCGWETLRIQMHIDYYGPGGHLFQSYDKGGVLKSVQVFSSGQVTGNFSIRMQFKDLGSDYEVTPQYRLPYADWQVFAGGSWISATYELTQTQLMMQINSGSDGTITFDSPTVYSDGKWYVDPTSEIQDSINLASSAETIVVFGGTHLESLYINKSLTIRTTRTAEVRGGGSYTSNYLGNSLTRKAVIFVVNSTNVVLKGLDIEGEGLGPGNSNGVTLIYSSVEIENCTISPNTANDMNSKAVEARASDLTIAESTIRNFGRTGIYFGNSTGGIYNSTVIGQVYNSQYLANFGVEVDAYRQGPSIVEMVGNEIYNCDNTFLPKPLEPSCAIIADYWRMYSEEDPSTITLERNRLHNNYESVELVSNPQSGAHYNDIYSNRHGIVVDPDYFGNNFTFDARCNWWGMPSGPSHSSNAGGTGDQIGDYVDYSPWLNNTFSTTPMTYHVNPSGTIEEAVIFVEGGDEILVHSGIYDEQIVINRSLTIRGFGGTTIIRPSSHTKLAITVDAPWGTTTKKIAPIVLANTTDCGEVRVENLKVDGINVAAVPSGSDLVAGILYLETGGAIDTVSIENIMQTGSDQGSGIYLGSKTSIVSIEVRNSTIKSFRRNGIEASAGMVAGKLTVNISNNTITGRGLLGGGEPAQEGVRIADNALGTVSGNRVSDFKHDDSSGAGGILFFDAGGSAVGNLIDNVQNGIGAIAPDPGAWILSFIDNTVSSSSSEGFNAQVQNEAASIMLNIEGNKLVLGSGDGIRIGLSPSYSPAGKITLLIEGNVIDSWQNGIHLVSSVGNGSLVFDNRIPGNDNSGILIESATDATNVAFHYNYIFGNTVYGVKNNAANIADAQFNWWGDPSGPYHLTENPSGRGDAVSDRVLFEPWLETIPERPTIKIDPTSSIVARDESFQIRVNITSATNVVGWEFKLFYSNAILNCTGVVEGSFLKSFGGTSFIKQINNAYNSTHGRLLLACSLHGDVSASGNGTLAVVTLKARSRGTSLLNLVETKLVDSNIPPQRIPHSAIGGNVYSDTLFRVDPAYSSAAVGESFTVNVRIAGVANAYGWEFKLFYRNAILNCTGVVEGSFLKSFGGTSFIKQINNAYNSTHGRLLLACSLHGDASAGGSGVLTSITFKAINGGITRLDLSGTKLLDTNIPPQMIPHTAIDGEALVPGYYDVAVVGMATSKIGCQPWPTVGVGYRLRANVTVENQGDLAATFSITLYANSVPVGTAVVSNLGAGARTTVAFEWNTTGCPYGNYTMIATASILLYEQDTGDNTLAGGWVLATIPGDVDGNFVVNIFDVVRITAAYTVRRGDPRFSPNADIDDNNVINIFDVVICTGHYGKRYP